MFKICLFFIVAMFSFCSNSEVNLAKDSIYQISSQWKNQNNKDFQLISFRGEPVILAMVYLSCPQACPMMVSKLQEIEKKILGNGASKYHIVLVSFDFEKDRSLQLKKFMIKRNLDESHWTMLTGANDDQVRELAIVLGVNYKKLEDGNYSHSNKILLLDAEGISLAKSESLSTDNIAIIDGTISVNKK